jgi:proteasome lid subunit RPN8/RPN11
MSTQEFDLQIEAPFWDLLLDELKRRGNGERESGAFLLAKPNSRRVTKPLFYDDLCPGCLDEGYVRFDSSGYVRLSDICQSEKIKVVADVHTHPGMWTGQSPSDREHPMMPRKGHVGLIVPLYAQGPRRELDGVGAYLYCGDGRWEDFRDHLILLAS